MDDDDIDIWFRTGLHCVAFAISISVSVSIPNTTSINDDDVDFFRG
eukprot:CAMPEP_0170797886 /NCGR_PEP_ID=MMETSP0733-20121128/25940_1 /TAXON_ID=186038 /ORGANISM="Fragilariopsis kerguelensis, Strain L26-C5" /LENGTH=45 /DNA_ID= /DNA_START= /DNA_END= /DNA_ORIENTATION=